MRRGLRFAAFVAVVLVGLAVVNAFVLNNETRPAEVTADGGALEEVSSVDLQVFDSPATEPGAEGAPIVLLHCFGCSSQWWNQILPVLNETHRVIRIDLIGHGGSEKPQSGYEMDAQGAAVAEALNSLGVRGATVVGHSLGGMVAASLAGTASELVDRVVLIGTASESEDISLPFTDKLTGTPVIGQALWRLRLDSMVKSGYQSAFAPDVDVSEVFPGDPDRVVTDNRAMTYDSFTTTTDEADAYLEEQPLASRLAATGVPLLFIDGSEDQIIDAEAVAEEFHAVPGAITEVIDGVGHSPNVEAPEETTELILDFAGVAGVSSDVEFGQPKRNGTRVSERDRPGGGG